MTGGSTRACQGETIRPTDAFACCICGDRIAAQKLHHMVGDSIDIFCDRCINKPSLHARLFPQCRNASHIDVFDHPTKLHHRTRAAARAYITERNAG